MKLKDLIEQYGEYEVLDTTDLNVMNAGTLERNEGIQIRLEKPKPKTVWDLEKGDTYFVAYYNGSTYICSSLTWKDMDYEKAQRETGILFPTKEEAEQDLERRKVETLLLKYGGRRWFDFDGDNYNIQYQRSHVGFIIENLFYTCQLGTIYFDTQEQAEKAIEQIGEERIKKALFEVR